MSAFGVSSLQSAVEILALFEMPLERSENGNSSGKCREIELSCVTFSGFSSDQFEKGGVSEQYRPSLSGKPSATSYEAWAASEYAVEAMAVIQH